MAAPTVPEITPAQQAAIDHHTYKIRILEARLAHLHETRNRELSVTPKWVRRLLALPDPAA